MGETQSVRRTICLTLDPELVAVLDELRDDIPRSRFIESLLIDILNLHTDKTTEPG